MSSFEAELPLDFRTIEIIRAEAAIDTALLGENRGVLNYDLLTSETDALKFRFLIKNLCEGSEPGETVTVPLPDGASHGSVTVGTSPYTFHGFKTEKKISLDGPFRGRYRRVDDLFLSGDENSPARLMFRRTVSYGWLSTSENDGVRSASIFELAECMVALKDAFNHKIAMSKQARQARASS